MSSQENLIDFLQDYHTRVFACEEEGKKALNANDGPAYQKAMIRHHIEQEYWRMQGVDFKFVFRSELNKAFAYNVQQVLMFYDERSVTCEAHMYMWLVAHKIIKIDLSDSIICFPKLVCGMEDKVRDLFERSVAYGYQP